MKSMETKAFTILVAEDDEDEQIIFKAALRTIGYLGECRFVNNDKELLDYLSQTGKYADVRKLPDLIVVDLNISEKWLDTHKMLKSKPVFDRIPVVILTPIPTDEINDVPACFDLEADAFVSKRTEFVDYLAALRLALVPFCGKAIE
jgi:CheY-like chemotaxis protein